jgi:DNA-binding CsgD family transcriptional regulator
MSIAQFRGDDVRALFHLVGEAREILRAGGSALAHVLERLASLTRAQVAADYRFEFALGLPPRVLAVSDLGWGSERDRALLYGYVATTPIEAEPMTGAILRQSQRVVTLARADAISDLMWERSALLNEVHRPAGVGDSLISLRRLASPGLGRAVVLKRAWGDPSFGARERDLLHLLQSECPWVFERPRTALADLELSPRERETLALLLTDLSQKQIAARLGLSRDTVHDYVKSLYKKLGVTSRAELMARAIPR